MILVLTVQSESGWENITALALSENACILVHGGESQPGLQTQTCGLRVRFPRVFKGVGVGVCYSAWKKSCLIHSATGSLIQRPHYSEILAVYHCHIVDQKLFPVDQELYPEYSRLRYQVRLSPWKKKKKLYMKWVLCCVHYNYVMHCNHWDKQA